MPGGKMGFTFINLVLKNCKESKRKTTDARTCIIEFRYFIRSTKYDMQYA